MTGPIRRAALPATLLAIPAAALLATPLATPLAAQQVATPLAPGRSHADSLAAGEVDRYTIRLEAGRFVVGRADQQTVDVVVTVLDPAGTRIATVDGPARGPELFQFDAERAGEYRIEVRPFEDAAGRYAIELQRVEPLATRPAERVDQLMAAYTGDVPGGVIGVVRDGRLAFAEAYGLANLTHGIPFEADTRTNIGSTSKQFTGFAIALLAERGELSLDDDVREHIPELPDFGTPITLRNLLNHTSGYREFLNALALAGRRIERGDWVDRDEIVALVQRQPELQNQPDAEFNYNNTGFALLTIVVERVTGQPFPEWMRENVFLPLGMESTVVRSSPMEIIPRSAQGYVAGEEGGWRDAVDLGGAMGAGGIYTTVADLARWVDNFRDPGLGGPGIFRRMTTRNVLVDGDTTDYGLGVFVDEWRGLERVHHGGADVAHRSMLRYYPELDAAVIALSNNATFNSAAMADDVAEAFFADRLEPEEEGTVAAVGSFDPDRYDPEDFDELAGRYALDAAPAFILSFFREGDTLWTQATGQPKLRIVPTSDSTFRLLAVPASVTFHRTPDGTADSITLHQNGHHLARRLEGETWEPTPEELDAFTGRYFSPELEAYYSVALDDGELRLSHRRFDEPIVLTPAGEEGEFTGGFPVARVEFVRDEDGAVVALDASNGRTRGIRFERIGDVEPQD